MGFITHKYFGGICTLIIQMRCLLNALQLWYKCCQHVHMFQAWPNISHAQKQFCSKVTHQRARLGCLALGSLHNPWRLQANLISSLAGCALFLLLHGDPRATGSDLREGGVSSGMLPSGRCQLGQVLGSSAALAELFLQEFPITVLTTAQQRLLWLPSAQAPALQDTDAHSRNRNSLVLPLERGWKRDKAIPALHLPPWSDLCADTFFSFTHHGNGLNLTSVQVLHGVKALTRPEMLSRWGWY